MKAVLDTNVWLDWLLFANPEVAPLRAAHEQKRLEVLIDAACEAELERVLDYRFPEKWPVDKPKLLAACRAIARKIEVEAKDAPLPRCADADDQKFLELAHGAGADCIVTRDLELLRLAKRTPFRILLPREFPGG